MKTFAAAALAALTNAALLEGLDMEFMKYISAFNKRYGTIEELRFRNNLFSEKSRVIEELNAIGGAVYGHNEFSDWTHDEYRDLLGYKPVPHTNVEYLEFEPTNEATVDWVSKGAVTKVKNQGSCGSCWAFSTTGSMEGAHFIKTGTLLSLSEQNLVDCSTKNNGCGGGDMDLAFQYTESAPLEDVADYPYKGREWFHKGCKYNASKGKVKVTSFKDVTPNSSEALKAAIAKGPVSVAIEADKAAFQSYQSGIIMANAGCGTNLDHGVLAVGYGTENGTPYYRVKNSWGPTWGDEGYVKLEIVDGKGVCGIQMAATQPQTD
jgi:cathepsin L